MDEGGSRTGIFLAIDAKKSKTFSKKEKKISSSNVWGVRASSSDLLADHEAEAAPVLCHCCLQLLLLLVGNIFQVQKQRAALKHSHDCRRTGQEAHTHTDDWVNFIIFFNSFLIRSHHTDTGRLARTLPMNRLLGNKHGSGSRYLSGVQKGK